MGLRLFSEFKSSNGKQYKIEIYDDDFTAVATSFNVGPNGFNLEYAGETDDIVSPIIGSTCVVSAYNNTSTFDSFVTNLMQRQESKSYMRVLLYDGSNYQQYWSGIILQDLAIVNDESKPRVFELRAVELVKFTLDAKRLLALF